jgi:hypothetical protein
MTDAITVYVSLGNSDDKLSQARWSEFREQVTAAVRDHAPRVHGNWVSPSADPWQNACIAFELDPAEAPFLKSELRDLAASFGQDSIAWAVVPVTEFVGPSQTLPA